jgi:hypothetical protein
MESNIALALYNAIETAVQASSRAELPRQMPGRVFTKPSDGLWLEIVHTRNNPENEFWGNERTYQGFVRALLHWPADDQGDIPAMNYLDELAAALPKGSVFTQGSARVVLYDVPIAGSKIVDDGSQIFPLTLKYRDFSA